MQWNDSPERMLKAAYQDLGYAEGDGLRAIATGFSRLGHDDFGLMGLEFPVHDALYAWCKSRVET